MQKKMWLIIGVGALFFLAACGVRQYDTYGFISFQVQRVEN
jgi:hypothetical protein